MDFSDVYLKAEQRIMVRKADADSYKDIDSFMRNRRILHTGGRCSRWTAGLKPTSVPLTVSTAGSIIWPPNRWG